MPHPSPQRSPHRIANPARWYRRLPWVPTAISLAVVLSSGMAVQPVRDAATFADVAEAYLVRPFGYVAIAPLSNVFDALTLASVRQHIALVLSALLLFIAWRIVVRVRRGAGWRTHATATALFVVVLLATYATGALLPRPMAMLESDNAHILRVDFHSHTDASHDGRQSVRQNRAWHRAAGFNVAFITDHATVAGAERAVAENPPVAGQDVTLLQSIEVSWSGEHVSIPGAQRVYDGLLTQNLRDVDPEGLRLGSMIPNREPVVIWHHPRRLDRLPLAAGPLTPGVRAIEIVNGAPHSMDDVRPKRGAILAQAQRNQLALTTGSDNHGWGRAAPGWTLMRIFNWRAMPPDMLAQRIETTIRGGGFDATRVVERVVADPGASTAWLVASLVTIPGRMLTTLSNDERVSWLIWTWAITAAVWAFRRRRVRAA